MAVDRGILVVCSSLLLLLVALIGLSALLLGAGGIPIAGVPSASTDRNPWMEEPVIGLGLGEKRDRAVRSSRGDIHISSKGTRPRDSISPGVL